MTRIDENEGPNDPQSQSNQNDRIPPPEQAVEDDDSASEPSNRGEDDFSDDYDLDEDEPLIDNTSETKQPSIEEPELEQSEHDTEHGAGFSTPLEIPTYQSRSIPGEFPDENQSRSDNDSDDSSNDDGPPVRSKFFANMVETEESDELEDDNQEEQTKEVTKAALTVECPYYNC